MDEQHQPQMNGDDDLAKTLNDGLQFEETPMQGGDAPAPAAPADDTPPMPTLATGDDNPAGLEPPTLTTPDPEAPADAPAEPAAVADEPPAVHHTHGKKTDAPKVANGNLDSIKASALEELRPLVGKLSLPPEEKFDTLLLIIRSTDDQGLLDEAHAAAKDIADDTRRAQALLDIVKEIDYFSTKR